jgi:hypothetical protein
MLTGGDLHMVAGLIFLGVVIAVCLWLLNWLFPNNPQPTSHNAALRHQAAAHIGHGLHNPPNIPPEDSSHDRHNSQDDRPPG